MTAISLSKLRDLAQFRLGSHNVPIEQGRMARPAVPKLLRKSPLCAPHAIFDERHFVLECPHLAGDLLQDAHALLVACI